VASFQQKPWVSTTPLQRDTGTGLSVVDVWPTFTLNIAYTSHHSNEGRPKV